MDSCADCKHCEECYVSWADKVCKYFEKSDESKIEDLSKKITNIEKKVNKIINALSWEGISV